MQSVNRKQSIQIPCAYSRSRCSAAACCTTYDIAVPYYADCLQNEGYGDLFSWVMVSTYQDKLCADSWRVPTKEDFAALDIALSGTGSSYTNPGMRDKYLTLWGASYGGKYNVDSDARDAQGATANYWTRSGFEEYSYSGVSFSFNTSGYVGVGKGNNKSYGFMLRCVR